MKIHFHDYELRPRSGLMGVRQGALLRVTWWADLVGYADVHPWPEYGDDPLETHLESLLHGELTPLIERSLVFARVDADLRRKNRNAFLGLALPPSHRLVPHFDALEAKQLAEWSERGYTRVKVKFGRHLDEDTKHLVELAQSTPLKWRLDFNARLSVMDFTHWWHGLPGVVRERIDFIEDPCAGELNITGPWADDWGAQRDSKVRIVKPAREDVEDVGSYPRVVFTHALDHTFGRACALWSAARFYQTHPRLMEPGGLASMDAYEPDDFARAWPNLGPRLKPTTGPGFGFGELLERVRWKPLS